MRRTLLTIFFALLFTPTVNAEEPGDPRAGLAFAHAHCAQCHAYGHECLLMLTRHLS